MDANLVRYFWPDDSKYEKIEEKTIQKVYSGKINVSRSKKQIKCMKDIRMHRQSNYLLAKECIEKEERVYIV